MNKTNKTTKLVWCYPHLKFFQGGTRFLFEVLSRFDNSYEKTLVTSGPKTEVTTLFEDQGLTVKSLIPLTTNSKIYWLFFPFFFIMEFIKAYPILDNADRRVATLFPSNLICAVHSLITRKSFIYYCYEPFPFLQNPAFINTYPPAQRVFLSLMRFLYAPLDTWATRKATTVLTLNEVTKRMIAEVYNKESVVTLMGVNSSHFRPQSENQISRLYSGKQLIVHSTDYTEMKRTDLAIQSIAQLVKKYPKLFLVITSTQPNSPRKQRYVDLANELGIGKHVEFAGLIAYDDLPKYYSAACCYLSTSYDEMLGTTSSNLPVKESMACETPAIRADITTEDVQDSVTGFLVNPRNTKKVSKKIAYLLDHPTEAKAMGKRARKTITDLYTWEHVVQIISQEISSSS